MTFKINEFALSFLPSLQIKSQHDHRVFKVLFSAFLHCLFVCFFANHGHQGVNT